MDALLVGPYSLDAMLPERARGIAEQLDGMYHTICQNRLIHVELEMPLAAGHRDRGVIAEHLATDTRHRFALRRVHLARHDRRARLILRQDQFTEAGTGARAQEANVVGDLEQAGRHRIDSAMG